MSDLLARIQQILGDASTFSIMLGISLLVHIAILIGVGFSAPTMKKQDSPMLEITIVNTKSDSKPEKADFLSNKTQDGGGNSDKKKRSTTPRQAEKKSTKQQKIPALPPKRARSDTSPKQQTLTAVNSPRKIHQPEKEKAAQKKTAPTPRPTPSVQQQRNERAELAAALDKDWQAYQKRPKRKFITARTREYKFASYMDAWRQKVERIGNLNYPVEAKRKNLTGLLMLEVAINQDGTINSIRLVRSSGRKILDNAAKKIVRMSAPFAPLPADLRKTIDILHITRTWQFKSGNKLISR